MGKLRITPPLAVIYNLILAYLLFFICRLLFLCVNYSYFTDITFPDLLNIFRGGIVFDTSGILYLNIVYLFLMLFPFHLKETQCYQQFTKGLFILTNSIGLIMNLMDTVYFQFTNRRTTASVLNEFSNEGNLANIIGKEILGHWYLTLIAIALIFLLFKAYRKPDTNRIFNLSLYYIVQTSVFLLAIPLCIWGVRGGIGRAVRPITISNANQYVNKPMETALVLNTPFSVLRTIGKKPFIVPAYFKEDAEMASYYTPVHLPSDSAAFKPLNVVVLIMESFGKEYIGALNGGHESYTPFLDSLIAESLTFEYSYANGRKSIDGMPSVLSGIPMFVEPFFLVPASLNNISGLGGELKKKGYYTAFFHGAQNGSMGFEAYARASGYKYYFGRSEYNNDKDFDGYWAIWDEEFLQFFAEKLSEFEQPFSTAVFTASSHHPYVIPKRYENVFEEGPLPIHRCIRYSDYSLKRFFDRVSKEPWYDNTLFVITADHTNQTQYPEFQTEIGSFSVPVIFHHRGSNLKGHRNGISQQIDIMPTVLNYLGYDLPYIAFGCDLLSTPVSETYAVNYINGIYQYVKGDYLLQFNGEKSLALYKFKTDLLLQDNILNKEEIQKQMELELKSIIQQYMKRMNNNQLVIDPE